MKGECILEHGPINQIHCLRFQVLTALHPRRLYTRYIVDINVPSFTTEPSPSYLNVVKKKVPLHAMQALGGRGDKAPIRSRPRHWMG
jgi:hypothetical protein